jgi:hypothetical protein
MNQDKVKDMLLALREGKTVNPSFLINALEWATQRAEGEAKAVRQFEVSRDKCGELLERIEQTKKEPAPLVEQDRAVMACYVAGLEGALLALDQKKTIDSLSGKLRMV